MLITVLILLVLAIAALVFAASRQPDEFRVTRTIVINATAEEIYPHISDLRKGNEWSPWTKLDPDMNLTYEGAPAGVGAVQKWDGNRQVGKGILTIMDLVPNELVRLRLEFLKPMRGVNTVEYMLIPHADGTMMSWTMYGPNTMIGKIMGVFMNCDKMCGDMFERGLINLRAIVESGQRFV